MRAKVFMAEGKIAFRGRGYDGWHYSCVTEIRQGAAAYYIKKSLVRNNCIRVQVNYFGLELCVRSSFARPIKFFCFENYIF